MRSRTTSSITPERLVELTDALCRAEQPDGGEERRARVVAALLAQPGIEVDIDWVLPGRPNVIARVRGQGTGPGLLLNGHLDAYYAVPGQWRRNPLDPWVEDDRIYGGGVTDMLGGVASMIAAVEHVARIGPPPGDLVLLASMHHDTIGLGVKFALAADAEWPRYGICGEPSSLQIHVANGGAVKFEVKFHGRTAHVSRLDESADALAAAIAFAGALDAFRLTHEPDPRLPGLPLVLVGELQGGYSPSAVADSAVLRGDVRTVPSMTRSTVRSDLEALLAEHCPDGVTTELTLFAVQSAFIADSKGPLIDAITSAHSAIRRTAVEFASGLPTAAFVVDASDMAAGGVESVVYGPADWHWAPDEYVEIAELVDAARIYAEVAMQLSSDGSPRRR